MDDNLLPKINFHPFSVPRFMLTGHQILHDGAIQHNNIDLKSHPIAQFVENRIIRKTKMLNSSKVNNKF